MENARVRRTTDHKPSTKEISMIVEIYPREDDRVTVTIDGSSRTLPNKDAAFEYLDGKQNEMDSAIETAMAMYTRIMAEREGVKG